MGIRFHSLLKQSSALTSVALLALATAQTALANPEGGNVVAGSATISTPDAVTLRVDQATDRAIINWDSFNIAAGETTRFALPSAESWTLNRVVGSQDPSRIHGSLISNGNLVVVNPDGFHFGSGATVDVNRLIATTADIGNDAFMAGQFRFTSPGNPSASIVNEGTISIADYGLAALVAPSVRNSGVIGARLGTVSLAAGNSFTIDPYGDGLINFTIGDEIAAEVFDAATGEAVSDLVENDGKLSADGGTVAMTSATARRAVNSVVNNTGVVEARSVGVQNGMIVLGGATAATKTANAPAQAVRVSGTLDASGTDSVDGTSSETPIEGGHIEITGEVVVADASATIDASGQSAGGTILFGGDYLGGNTTNADIMHLGVTLEAKDIPTARYAFVEDGARLSVDALGQGDGGKLIVWSDEATFSVGHLSARGGPEGGDGGFIETSGAYLQVGGVADAGAPLGQAGTWLLDPMNIAIDDLTNGLADIEFGEWWPTIRGDGTFNNTVFRPTDNTSVISASMIESQLDLGTNVVVSTFGTTGPGDGHIFLRSDIRKTSGGDARLFLGAEGSVFVTVGVNVTSTSGAFTFDMFGDSILAGNIGQLDLNGGALLVTPRYSATLSTASPMPQYIEVYHRNGEVGSNTGQVDLRFGEDRINYKFASDYIEVESGGVDLRDSRSDGLLWLTFAQPAELWLHNASVISDDRHGIGYGGISGAGTVPTSALDGVPEVLILGNFGETDDWMDGFSYNLHDEIGFIDPSSAVVPVVEFSLDPSREIDGYLITGPSGFSILDAYLNSIALPPPPPPAPEPEPVEDQPQSLLIPSKAGENPVKEPETLTEIERFLERFSGVHNEILLALGEDLGKTVVSEFVEIVSEFGMEATLETFWQYKLDSIEALLRRADVKSLPSDAIAMALAEAIVERVIEHVFPEANAPLITDIASDITSLIVAIDLVQSAAGTTSAISVGNASAISSSVSLAFKTFKIARGFAQSSYEEDQNFAAAASSLISADNLRLAAAELESSGDSERAAHLRQLANDVVNAAADATKSIFTGVDGPVVADLLAGMDEVIQVWRSGDTVRANELLSKLYAQSEERNGGITNDFYERYFMLLRAPDTQRAYSELYGVLEKVVVGAGG